MITKKVNVVFVMTLRSCSHNAKFGLFCKKICQQEAISSANDFSNYQNFLDCHQTSKMPLRTFGGVQFFARQQNPLILDSYPLSGHLISQTLPEGKKL